MEPTICFRLCDRPIIYIQKTVCRCSGGGLTHQDRQSDKMCSFPCTKPVDRAVSTFNTCGGPSAYSVYVQENFYSLHGHLFNYRIEFSACELWRSSDVYDTHSIQLTGIVVRSSLNKLEQCAAACLDHNATTKSIAFNGDSDKCLCIMPLQSNRYFQRIHYTTSLSNTSCDLYCNNTAEGSKTTPKYKCGSTNSSQIWAIYDLNGTCPLNFAYIKDLNKCVYTYKNFWNQCTPPSTMYTFDGSVSWKRFLNVISTLNLSNSTVTVDFDESVVIDSSWKCPVATLSSNSSTSISLSAWRSYLSHSRSSLYGWNTNTRYILENGCLTETSHTSFSHRYSYRICVTDPIDRYSLDADESNETYIAAVNPTEKFCPTNWFDPNGRCYRMSDERKTIEQARNSCISESSNPSKSANKPKIWLTDGNGNIIGNEEQNESPSGEVVEYASIWQARLGFFLLDTDPDSDDASAVTTSTVHDLFYDESLISSDTNETVDIDHAAINEFQAADGDDDESTSASTKNTCVLITRSVSEEEERPIIQSTPSKNCSTPRHVLCEANTLIVQNFQYNCLSKPQALDLPSLISNQLTHELCLSVCQELQTKLAVLNVDKCYCLNGATPKSTNITADFLQYQQKSCGKPCLGNSHEICGDENTIVVFQILDPRRTFTFSRTPAEPYPKYFFDNCVQLLSFNRSVTYQFTLTDVRHHHPRYCLALCTKYKQKYALINNGICLCTNKEMKGEQNDVNILTGQTCDRQCQGNYFYTCGSKDNSTIYSVYILKPKCTHGFEVAENNEQCVYTHFSTKMGSLAAAQTYCESLGSKLAKINDIVEIQDILPETILHTRLMQQLLITYKFKFVNDTRYYWIDRTNDAPDPNSISERLLGKCAQMPEIVDRNCIAIQYIPSSNQSRISHERCISESDACSTQKAMPVCVDQHLESQISVVPPITKEQPADVSANITVLHSCEDGTGAYHLVDDYCYKISPHEVSWNDAREECQRDNAVLFVPEKSVTLQYIKSLYLRQRSYTSSGQAHVGVFYNYINQTTIQYNADDEKNRLVIPDSNAIYDLCEKTFQERYEAVMRSSSLTILEKDEIKKQQIGCAYIDLTSSAVPIIRCDEIPCSRTAAIICQKAPIPILNIIIAKRKYSKKPSTRKVTKSPSATIVSTGDSDDNDNNDDDEEDDDDQTTTVSSDAPNNSTASSQLRSIGRDFAPLFFILAILFAFILLGFLSVIHNRRGMLFGHSNHRPAISVYSQLTSASEFDLN